MFRWMIFDAIITDRSTASRADLLQRAAGFQLNLALGVPHDAFGLGAAPSARISSRSRSASARLCVMIASASTRALRMICGRLLVQPLQFLLRLLRVVERLADRLLPRLRAPRAAAARRTSPAAPAAPGR